MVLLDSKSHVTERAYAMIYFSNKELRVIRDAVQYIHLLRPHADFVDLLKKIKAETGRKRKKNNTFTLVPDDEHINLDFSLESA